MNKLILLLALFVLFVLAMGFYLLIQSEEKPQVQNKDNSQEITKSNKQNLKSTPTFSNSNTSESKIPLKASDTVRQLVESDSDSIDSASIDFSTTTTLPLNTTQDQSQKTINQPQVQNKNIAKSDLVSEQNKNITRKKIHDPLPEMDYSEKLHLTFVFLNEDNPAKTNRVKVAIPIKTHVGFINEYSYSAKLENEQFSITWDIPNWFQNTKNVQIKKDVQLTNNSFVILNISGSERMHTIKLYQMLAIEITFETPDNTLIPDGTKFKFFENPYYVEIYSPLITNQKGIIYVKPEKVLEINSITIGQYYTEAFFVGTKVDINLTRTILLKKKIPFIAVISDQNQLPLKDHYVIFSKSYFINNLREILNDFEKNGKIDESKYEEIYKSNTDGEIFSEANTFGEYFAIIFGPKIKGSIRKDIKILDNGQKLIIKIDVSSAEIKLNFLENGKLFTGNLEGLYWNNYTSSTFSINTGTLILSKLQAGKFELHLKSNVFVNTTILLTVPEVGLLEQNIELKPGAFLSGTLTSNNKPILGKNLSIYIYEKGNASYDHKAQTDLNGYFQFKGLNPELTYIFHIDLPNYRKDPDAPNEFRTNEKDIFINVIEKYDFVGLVFDETGNPIMIHNVSRSIARNDKIVYDGHPRIEKNKFTIGLDFGDKISFCIIAKGFASHYQTVIFEPFHLTNPLVFNLKKGILAKGTALDTTNKPISSGIIVEAALFHYGNFYSNKVDVHKQERTALGGVGTFQIENAQIGEKFYLLSKDNSPIPFTIEEKHRNELIELKATKSYSFSGNLRSQKNIFQEGRRIIGERIESNEHVDGYVDAKGNFYIDCLRPGKWVFTSNFRDMYKVVPRIEIEIIDKNETYDWVVYR